MDGFAEFIKLIGDKCRVEDVILILDVSLDVPDEVVLIEFDLVLLFDDLRRRFLFLSHLMSIPHSFIGSNVPQNSIDWEL